MLPSGLYKIIVLVSVLKMSVAHYEDHEFQNASEYLMDFLDKGNFIMSRQGLKGDMTMPGAIKKNGYPYEVHEIVTQDGYILTAFRIPFGLQRGVPKRKPVLFHHALFSDATEWFINHKENILALQLADLGFDIWLVNARGSRYSRRHKTLTDKDKQFFQFSMDEIGNYDVPAEIDYILQTTGERKLFYFGHSMGGAVIMITLSDRPEYNEKICLATLFAPAVSVVQGSPTLKPLGKLFGRQFSEFLLQIVTSGTGELPAPFFITLSQVLIKSICSIPGMLIACNYLMEVSQGGSFQTSPNLLPNGADVFPGPSSWGIMTQFLQWLLTGKFEKYDYGSSMNMKKYGTPKPPLHNLKHVTAPVSIYGGRIDLLITPHDITRLSEALPNVVALHRIKGFNHIDFVTAKKLNERVNTPVKELMLKYS